MSDDPPDMQQYELEDGQARVIKHALIMAFESAETDDEYYRYRDVFEEMVDQGGSR